MAEIPLVWLVTALTSIAALALRRAVRLPLPARVFLALGVAGIGALGLLLGLRVNFALPWATVLQPMVGLTTAPALYLGLEALTRDGPYPWRGVLLRHWAPILAVLLGLGLAGFWLADIAIPLVTLIYLVLLSRLAVRPFEAFIHVTPRDQPVIKLTIFGVVALFSFFLLADLVIFIALVTGGPDAVPGLVSRAAVFLTVFVFLAALLAASLVTRRDEGEAPNQPAPDATEDDRELLEAFDTLLHETRLFTDSGLTLARAARRLGVPARRVSEAVNRVTGSNVSRHINGFRVAHAQDLLRTTVLPVTEVMLEAGFLSKSTFNTEFRRITGKTPSAYRGNLT